MAGTVVELEIGTRGQGLIEITDKVQHALQSTAVVEGLCTVFVRHTSASLTIQENADPSARHDLERWLARLVPEGDPHFTHTAEGPDDMPSHIRSALTSVSVSVPYRGRRLLLGTWQGIFLWEHRRMGSRRRVVVHCG